MVLNSSVAVTVASVSANICQYIACNPQRLSSDQVLHLLCCLPLVQFRRLALSLWTYICFDPNNSYLSDNEDDDSHSD